MKRDVPAPTTSSSSEATSPKLTKPSPAFHSLGGRVWPPAWLPPLAILVVILLWPFIAYGAAQAWRNSQNRVDDWFASTVAGDPRARSFF